VWGTSGARHIAWTDLTPKLGTIEFTRKVTGVYHSRGAFLRLLDATIPGRAPKLPPHNWDRDQVVVIALGPRSSTPVARRTGNAAGHVSVPRAEHARQGEARLRQAGRPMSEHDPLIRQIREQISDNDRAIIEAINTRLKLVARLKSYKESRGMSFVDPEREEWMLQYLARANRGPLSADGLREIFEALLDLTKREV